MKLHRFSRTAILLMSAAIFPLGIITVSAQAATVSSARPRATVSTAVARTHASPDFTCPSASVCVFQDNNWSGAVFIIPTANGGETWVDLTTGGALALPWRSFHDNSGSSVTFGDAQTGLETCFLPGTKLDKLGTSFGNYRYMWIEFGNTGCTGQVGPLPKDTAATR
jgi:hypothetical protein